MALSRRRIHEGGESPYPHEREAIASVLEALDDRDPFEAWPLQEFVDRSTGDLLEVDLLVLGPNALYVVEIKSYPDGSKLAGDAVDWRWSRPDDSNWRYVSNPLRTANRKAKILKGLLGRDLDRIRVEALIFVSTQNIERSKLTDDGRNHVVFRSGVVDALTRADFPGAHPKLKDQRIDRPTQKAIVQQLAKAGVRARRVRQRFGSWELQGEISDGPGWQEYLAFHQSLPKNADSGQARVRVYRRPPAEDSKDHRERLRKIAQREFHNLYQLRDCAQILQAHDYCENATTHDPAIVFEPFERAAPFASFLRQNPELSFDARLKVVEQVAHALHACHKKDVLHRGLHPDCVLVRQRPSGELEVRVAGFQHARDFDQSTLQTLHATELESPDFLLYRAPEMLGGLDAGSPESDVYSLAAFAYFAFTGRPPARDPDELVRTVREHGGLRPGLAQDDLTLLDPVFLNATQAEPLRRPTVLEFLEALEEALTGPAEEREIADPRDAKPKERLEGGFLVLDELGRGSSARVLEVEFGDGPQHAALKVPIDASREDLLRAEAKVLENLDHQGVVRLLDVIRPSGITCLLLRLADRETLHDRLRLKGPQSLDLAHRYGKDLLETLAYLESRGVTHRDVKPHNLGFTREVDKKQSRLLLFDFSLSPVEADKIGLGTVAYRDPWLAERKLWDAAADRYAAAVTLHEMLTGVRPDYGHGAHPAAVRDARPRIDASRFDGAVRNGLVPFFEKALAARVDERFESADDMRFEWERIFRAPGTYDSALTGVRPAAAYELSEELSPDTPLAAFVHAPRLLDALERGRAETALDVARLPRNRLSAVPGIGKETQAQILDLVTALRARFPAELARGEPLLPSFRLPPEPLLDLSRDLLPQEALQFLHAAGLQTTTDLARAPVDLVDRLLAPCKLKASKVRRHLEAYQSQADAEGVPPTTLDGWLELFLQAGKLDASRSKAGTLQLTKTKRAGWAWLGLPTDDAAADAELGNRDEDPLVGFARTSAIAKAVDASQPTVSNAIGRARDHWQTHPHKDAFIKLVRLALQPLGGAAALPDAAERLRRQLDTELEPAASGVADLPAARRRAAALLRIATLLPDAEGIPAIVSGPLHGPGEGPTWCATDMSLLRCAAELGLAADELVAGAAVPPFATARERLEEVARASALPPPPAEVLLPLAARASRAAACSRKLELYPKGLAAASAVNLARAAIQSAVLTAPSAETALGIDGLRTLVGERYPDADPLPDRPELDRLLEPLSLVWSEDQGGFVRRPEEPTAQPTIQRTRATRSATHLVGQRPMPSERERQAIGFHDTLKLAVEKRVFRLIQCLDTEYEDTIAALSRFLGTAAISFDRLLIEQMDALIAEKKVQPEVVLRTDRLGPPMAGGGAATATRMAAVASPDWQNLCKLAAVAAQRVLPAVGSGPDAPRLVVHLGLIARYRLGSFLDTWLRACEEGDGHAVFAVVPSEQGDDPTIDGQMPVPLTSLGSQRLWVDAQWLQRERDRDGQETVE